MKFAEAFSLKASWCYLQICPFTARRRKWNTPWPLRCDSSENASERINYYHIWIYQEPSVLEDGIRVAREALSEVGKQAGLLVDQVNHVVETGKAHTQGAQ